jgi:hypothetical protein
MNIENGVIFITPRGSQVTLDLDSRTIRRVDGSPIRDGSYEIQRQVGERFLVDR